MSRRSVDLPHPDGPISETNAPFGISRSICCNAGVLSAPAPKTLSTARTRTTESGMRRRAWRARRGRSRSCFGGRGAPSKEDDLGRPDEREEADAHDRGHDDRCPQLRWTRDVELVEVEDRPAQSVADARGQLADDRADDARGRRDLE